jgi:hypothetical protein
MKKLFTVLALVLVSQVAFSQEVGIRFGDVLGNDVAIDAIFKTSQFSRIHADVSFGNGVGVDVLWDFLYKPFSIEGEGFNWYLGAGPSIYINDPFYLGVSGEVGIEYQFKFPMAIGIDWRPTFWLIENTDFHAGGFGVNLRYVFGKNK